MITSTYQAMKENKDAGFPIGDQREGAQVYASVEAIAKKLKTLQVKDGPAPPDGGRKVITYTYGNPVTGAPDMAVFRVEPGIRGGSKDFWQARSMDKEAGIGWVLGAPEKNRPLYNRKRVAECDEPIVIVEGEKCVHALHDIGIVATTCSGGANASAKTDWTPLRGKSVILWPDNDPIGINGKSAGLEHMLKVAEILEQLDCSISMVDPAEFDLGPKGDAADFVADCIARGMKPDIIGMETRFHLRSARSMGASRQVSSLIEDIIEGRHVVLDSPWPWLDKSAQWLMPGTISVICGDPGDGKSWWMFQLMHHIQASGHRIGIMTLEEDRQFWLRRVLGQISGVPDIMNQTWVKAKPEDARRLTTTYQADIDKMGARIADCPDKLISFRDLLRWVEKELESGARVLAIDPVTAIETGDKRHNEDLEFVVECKSLLRKYGASLVAITHPRTAAKGKRNMDDLAGGRAWSRFVQNVFWIERTGAHSHFEVLQIQRDGLRQRVQMSGNRLLHQFKTRNGTGAGSKIVMVFQNLVFTECGLHLRNLKKQEDGLPDE